jgi:cystathionine beta-lyase
LGYSFAPDSCYEAISDWLSDRHGFEVEKEWILFSPNVVFSLNACIAAFTEPGDTVVVQPPVYPPFFNSIKGNERKISHNPLKMKDGRYIMDFEDLERKLEMKPKMLVLCSPHNPVGRVWQKAELMELSEMCLRKKVLLVSDEIHFDLVFHRHKHVPTASLTEEIAQNTVTLTAPSKTFNMPGVHLSYLVISNKEMRERYQARLKRVGVSSPNIFGIIGTEAAYRECSEWLEELLLYLEKNLRFLLEFIKERMPQIDVFPPEGTFLAWLDFRELGMDDEQLKGFLVEKAGIGLNHGPTFGPGGEGFQRLNFGCPRVLLEQALEKLDRAIREKKSHP